MKFKLGELKLIAEGIEEILDKELPIKAAYRLGKLLNQLQAELKNINQARLRLILKYSLEKDEKGTPAIDKETNRYIVDEEKFAEEYMTLLQEEIDIDFEPISVGLLGDIKISPATMAKLERLLEG